MHTFSLSNEYGDVVAAEQVPSTEFNAALRRFYNRAVERSHAVVELDGILHTRNSFLEFVRHFNDCSARAARLNRH